MWKWSDKNLLIFKIRDEWGAQVGSFSDQMNEVPRSNNFDFAEVPWAKYD